MTLIYILNGKSSIFVKIVLTPKANSGRKATRKEVPKKVTNYTWRRIGKRDPSFRKDYKNTNLGKYLAVTSLLLKVGVYIYAKEK